MLKKSKAETEDPREYAHQHHLLDAEPAQEKWDGEDEKSLGDLGNRQQQVGMSDPERTGIEALEVVEKGATKGVGDLQGGADEHAENQEHEHLPVFE
jgi:hypothetical protein